MAWQWHHFLPASKTRQSTLDIVCHIVLNWKLLHIVHASLCLTEHYHINSKSGVNFQVTLKRKHIKRDLHVMRFVFIIFCVSLCSNVQSFLFTCLLLPNTGNRMCMFGIASPKPGIRHNPMPIPSTSHHMQCHCEHCNNVLSSPFHFSKWPFYFKEFICTAYLFPYKFLFQS